MTPIHCRKDWGAARTEHTKEPQSILISSWLAPPGSCSCLRSDPLALNGTECVFAEDAWRDPSSSNRGVEFLKQQLQVLLTSHLFLTAFVATLMAEICGAPEFRATLWAVFHGGGPAGRRGSFSSQNYSLGCRLWCRFDACWDCSASEEVRLHLRQLLPDCPEHEHVRLNLRANQMATKRQQTSPLQFFSMLFILDVNWIPASQSGRKRVD